MKLIIIIVFLVILFNKLLKDIKNKLIIIYFSREHYLICKITQIKKIMLLVF
jgi:hypothetical protein